MPQRFPIPRRTVLRGLGAALALPWLEIMAPAVSRAATTEKPPLRLGVLFKGNGVHPQSWDVSSGSETEFPLPPLLEPLAPVRDQTLILGNLAHREGGGSHQAAAVAFLSGAATPGSIDLPQPVTLDQVIADKLGGQTPLRSLELTADTLFLSQPRCSYISYGADGKAVRREDDPQIVFDRLFRGPLRGERLPATRSILDAVLEDASALRRSASLADGRTLDAYLEAVRSIERSIAVTSVTTTKSRPAVKIPELVRPSVPENLPNRIKALLDLMVLAFWTDTTRVITFMLANDNSRLIFDFLGINEEHHYLSHFVRHKGVEHIQRFNVITRWHVAQFAYLIERLGKIADRDGTTVLDNSVLLFGSGLKHGDYHSASDLPIVLAGGGGGTLRTGRWVRFAEPRPYANLLLSLLNGFGIAATRFGSSDGPLPGLDGPLGPTRGPADDGTWRVVYGEAESRLSARGLLLASTRLDEANVYYIQLSDRTRVKVQAKFSSLDDLRFEDFCGRVVTVVGRYTRSRQETVLREVTSVHP
jgi:hypothetical protein